MLKRIVIVLILITWPVSLLLNNTFRNFLSYLFPLFEPKFAIFPFLFIFFYFRLKRPLLLIVSIIILLVSFKPFFGQTIFITNNDAKEELIQKGNLYNSIFLARLFQNKPRILLTKFTNNFMALTDPNNYFFGFAPGQIKIDNQNLIKFPFLSLPFLLIGIFYFTKIKNRKLIISTIFALLINLSFITNFDRNDFLLWIPILIVIIYGLNIFDSRFKYAKYYELIFILFSLIEITRLFLK